MPSCLVKACKNNSEIIRKCHGITYHSFPTNNKLWIGIIRDCRGEDDWTPSKTSKICSAHFDETDLEYTKSGRRHLVKGAIPKWLLFESSNAQETIATPLRLEHNIQTPKSETVESLNTVSSLPQPPYLIKKEKEEPIKCLWPQPAIRRDESVSIDKLTILRLKKKLNSKQLIIENYLKKIKLLNQNVRRLRNRNKSLKDKLKSKNLNTI